MLNARIAGLSYTRIMNRRINVRGIIVKDGKLFAVRHKQPDGSDKGFWCTPGGGLEDGESLEDGIRREILEETGITAQVGRLLFIQQFSKTGDEFNNFDEFLEFFFLIENSDAFDNISLEDTSHGTAEIAEFAFVNPAETNLLPRFLRTIDIESALTKNSPVFIADEL